MATEAGEIDRCSSILRIAPQFHQRRSSVSSCGINPHLRSRTGRFNAGVTARTSTLSKADIIVPAVRNSPAGTGRKRRQGHSRNQCYNNKKNRNSSEYLQNAPTLPTRGLPQQPASSVRPGIAWPMGILLLSANTGVNTRFTLFQYRYLYHNTHQTPCQQEISQFL